MARAVLRILLVLVLAGCSRSPTAPDPEPVCRVATDPLGELCEEVDRG